MHYPKKIEELTRKLLSGEISPEELEALNEWYNTHHPEHEPLIEIDQQNAKKNIWRRLEKDVQAEQKIVYTQPLYPFFRVAAAVLIVLGLTLSFVYLTDSPAQDQPVINYVEKVNPAGKRSSFQLPDGSRVWLNAKSILRYPKQFTENQRDITLEGEAYFEVVRNEKQPFIVHSGGVATKVLGTAFNVKSLPQSTTTVTVAEGKVQVAEQHANSIREENKVILSPNQQVVYNPGAQVFEKKEVNAALFFTWKEDTLRFDELPLKDVAIMIEQWYDVEVSLANKALESCIIVGNHAHESLENVLEAIRFAVDIEYEINHKKVIIRGRGCS